MNQRELDDVVALVSERTMRNVSLDDVTGRVIAYNTVVPTADQVRIDAVMSKEVPSGVRNWEASHGVGTRTHAFLVPGNLDSGSFPRICIPLLVRGVRVGYLWVQANSHDDVLPEVLYGLRHWQNGIEHIAGRVLVALDSHVGFNPKADKNLTDLVSGQSVDVHEELSLWMPAQGDVRLVVFTGGSTRQQDEPLPSLAYTQAIHDASRISDFNAISFADNQHGVFLVPSLSLIEIFIDKLSNGLRVRSTASREFSVPYGVSARLQRVGDCRIAYRQAITALQATSIDPSLTSHAYEELGIYQLLSQAGSAQVPQSLLKLQVTSDGEEKLRFLERIYDSPGPMQRVADSLHMHRTSIYNHLQRIEKVIGTDPLDPFVRLELHTGLKLMRWLTRPRFEAPLVTPSEPQVF